jgi:hypothetical protein
MYLFIILFLPEMANSHLNNHFFQRMNTSFKKTVPMAIGRDSGNKLLSW